MNTTCFFRTLVRLVLCCSCLGLCLLLPSCGVYTFTQSSLPQNLKTIDIPLLANTSGQPNVAEALTDELSKSVQSGNLLRIVSDKGDATLKGIVTGYSTYPYTYGQKAIREVDVSQYAVKITVDVEFLDNKNDKPLYKGTISGEGIYEFKTETEEKGRKLALRKVADQVMQNSVQSW